MNNEIYLRRRNRVVLPPGSKKPAQVNYVTTMMRNLEPLGCTFSQDLFDACRHLTASQVTDLYNELVSILRRALGAHRKFKPMYPNFPDQVMLMSDAQLYLNAFVHYSTSGKWLPPSTRGERPFEFAIRPRFKLKDEADLRVIDLGTTDDFEAVFTSLVAANVAFSDQDKDDVSWFVSTYGDDIERLLPERAPQKENVAFLAALLLDHTDEAVEIIARYCRTATDVLRLAVAMSEGDVSLALSTRFRSFSRRERRLLLTLLERTPNMTEDMLRWKGRWVRLGERLHPREYAGTFPKTAEAFDILRNDRPFQRFSTRVEAAMSTGNVLEAAEHLRQRPGDFARRLDHLLRSGSSSDNKTVSEAFSAGADRVSTPVLMQVRAHFQHRAGLPRVRVFFPKGNVSKVHFQDNHTAPIDSETCMVVATICKKTLVDRFASLSALGNVYVDKDLMNYPAPFALRSASRSYRTLTRGSRMPLPENCRVLRFFVWWKNGRDRTDVDLSAILFNSEFARRDVVTYYNLKTYGGVHSGDIVDAPNGASEFIDIELDKLAYMNIRYVAMVVMSYTDQPYCDLPECFAGWMSRHHAGSGEIYQPKFVVDRLDITAESRIAIPLVFDVHERTVTWCDMALRRNPTRVNNVRGNLSGIAVTIQAIMSMNKPTLYDLFMLHGQARGRIVNVPEAADTVFSVDNGTPFRIDEIASEYMA